MIFFSLYCRNNNFCITDRYKSVFDGNILSGGCLTKLENFRESQGVGGSDKQPLEWKFLGGGGGGGMWSPKQDCSGHSVGWKHFDLS